ncbi:hypothetical protein MG295_00273 [Bacillus phage vB_BcgM]|nr:hypothetical protein MG295_00273 [Bacillus phage vB_BcgM]
MRYNGFWNNKEERIVISRTSEDGIIHYRVVDEKGKILSRLYKAYAEDTLIGYIKEGSNQLFKGTQ